MKYSKTIKICLLFLIIFISSTRHKNQEKHSVNNIKNVMFSKAAWGKVRLHGIWKIPPRIIICDNAVKKKNVERALNFWRKLGYTFGTVEYENDFLKCQKDMYGVIKIMIPSNQDNMQNKMAITELSINEENGANVSADIRIWGWAEGKSLVLEHEIGHALGWLHSGMVAHIMYPNWTGVGHASDSVKHKDYFLP